MSTVNNFSDQNTNYYASRNYNSLCKRCNIRNIMNYIVFKRAVKFTKQFSVGTTIIYPVYGPDWDKQQRSDVKPPQTPRILIAILGLFLVNDRQTSPLKKSRFFKIQNNAQCSETNEKSIFQFLQFFIFEIRSLNLNHLAKKYIVLKNAQCFETDF